MTEREDDSSRIRDAMRVHWRALPQAATKNRVLQFDGGDPMDSEAASGPSGAMLKVRQGAKIPEAGSYAERDEPAASL